MDNTEFIQSWGIRKMMVERTSHFFFHYGSCESVIFLFCIAEK